MVRPVIVFGGSPIAEPTLVPPKPDPRLLPVLKGGLTGLLPVPVAPKAGPVPDAFGAALLLTVPLVRGVLPTAGAVVEPATLPLLGVVPTAGLVLVAAVVGVVPVTGVVLVVGVVPAADVAPVVGATPLGVVIGTTPEAVTEPVSAPVAPVTATPLGTALTRGAFTPVSAFVSEITVPVLSGEK